jgi:SWI/SNF-related matrix-associated actin-dependent regulator of chromatin subfamily A-like protein 1
MLKLFPYQERGVRFLLNGKARLLADEQGLGKTIQVVEARNQTITQGEKTLVVCPAAVKYNWKVTFENHGILTNIQVIDDGKTDIDNDADIVIVNYEYLHRKTVNNQLKQFDASVVVVDEAHYLAHGKARRTSSFLDGQHGILANRTFRHVWLLTGTPMTNRPFDLFPILRAFAVRCLGKYKDPRRFAIKFCGARFGDYSANSTKGASNLNKLAVMIRPFYLRREKKDVLPDLPEKYVNVVYFEPNELIKKFETDIGTYREYLKDGKDLGQTSTLRKELAIEKVKVTKSYIEAIDEPTILFYHHRQVGDNLLEMFPDAVRIDGRDTAKTKSKKIEEYKKRPRILIAQIGSVGTGVDGLQSVCHRAIFIELPWAPGSLGQAIDRLHRIGQKHDVLVELLVLHKCFDEKVYKALNRKQRNIEKVIIATKEEKENTMSIEKNIERIADALETIAANGSTAAALLGAAKDETKTATKTGASKAVTPPPAKAKTTAKTVVPGFDRNEAIQVSGEYCKKFMDDYQQLGYGDRKAGQEYIKNNIYPAGKIMRTNLTDEELVSVMAILKRGCEAIVGGASDDDDDDEL